MDTPLGKVRHIPLTKTPIIVKSTEERANALLIQAQGGDACYRIDGTLDSVYGFIIPANSVWILPVSTVCWATEVKCRLIVQELRLDVVPNLPHFIG